MSGGEAPNSCVKTRTRLYVELDQHSGSFFKTRYLSGRSSIHDGGGEPTQLKGDDGGGLDDKFQSEGLWQES